MCIIDRLSCLKYANLWLYSHTTS